MLNNFWYAVEFSQTVAEQPQLVQLFGQKIVLFRDAQGKVYALNNGCPHRGASLALGKVQDNCLVCPYHGWQFNPDGKCRRIPANQAGAAIPARAKVNTFPVREKDGWIWLFWGEHNRADTVAIPAVPDVHDPELRMVPSDFQWQVNYERAIENLLDVAHAPFVHGGSFGNPDEPELVLSDIMTTDWGASAQSTISANPPKGLWKFLSRGQQPRPVEVSAGFVLPNLTSLEITLAFGRLVLWIAHVPIDEQLTVSKTMSLRSFFKGKWADGDARKRTIKIFRQDQPIVESQEPQRLPTIDQEIHVAADALQLKYREYREKAMAANET